MKKSHFTALQGQLLAVCCVYETHGEIHELNVNSFFNILSMTGFLYKYAICSVH